MEFSFNIVFAIIGFIILLMGLFSRWFKRYVSPPLIAMISGILVGPAVLDYVSLSDEVWETTIEQTARICLAVGLMGVALRLKPDRFKAVWKTGGLLISLGMLCMWLFSTVITYLTLNVGVLIALLVAAVITPIDPIVSSSITEGRLAKESLPQRMRSSLSLESGANDGLGYLFVYLPILLLEHPTDKAFQEWVLQVLLWEVVMACLIGALIGYAAGKMINMSLRKSLSDKSYYHGYTIGLGVFTLAVAKLWGTDGILSVFVAGLFFNFSTEEREQVEEPQDVEEHPVTLPFFFLFGIVLPWRKWFQLGGAGIWFAVLILLFRRIPALLIFYRWLPKIRSLKEALFIGWFGPIGVSAIFYAVFSLIKTHRHEVWVMASLAAFSSVIAHGVTSGPFTRWFKRTES